MALVGALLLLAVMVVRFRERRPPYFERPRTIADHEATEPRDTPDMLRLLEKARPLMRKHSSATCFRPRGGKQWDDSLTFLTAVGMLPEQHVVPPARTEDRDRRPEYVVAFREPFTDPNYSCSAVFPEGALYSRIP